MKTVLIIKPTRCTKGTAVAQWLRCCATNWKVAGSILAGVSGFFNGIIFFRSHYGPGVDSASNRNEYQEYFLGGKAGRYLRLTTLPPSCGVVMKSGNLKFLEPSGPVQAFNGTALPLPLDTLISQIYFWNKTLHVSDSSSVHHQEFFTVYTAVV
jgi:hypothetical protein